MINEELNTLIATKEEYDIQIQECLTKIEIIKQKINENTDIPEIINTLIFNLKREKETLKMFLEESDKILENIVSYCSNQRKENFIQRSKCSEQINHLKSNNFNPYEKMPVKVRIIKKSQMEKARISTDVNEEHLSIYDKAYSEMVDRIGKKENSFNFQENFENKSVQKAIISNNLNQNNKIVNSKNIINPNKETNSKPNVWHNIFNKIKDFFTTNYKITKVKSIEEKESEFENFKNVLKNEGNKSFVPKVAVVTQKINNGNIYRKNKSFYR